MSLVVLLIAASASTASAAAPANPLANAEKGLLQCYRPDVQNRTCQSIAAYRRIGRGTYDNKAVIPISDRLTIETHTPVVIKNGAVCGFVRTKDMAAGLLREDDRVVDREIAKPVLQRISRGFPTFGGKEICTRYKPSEDGLTAKASVAGTYRPDMDQAVIWVSPSDGYIVTP